MKKILSLVIVLIVLAQSACTKNVFMGKNAPPGQVKKMTGSKSAAPYAPGQRKKNH